MTDLIKSPSHYTSGCSSIGRPIIEAIVNGLQELFPYGDALEEGWELQECKNFVKSVQDSVNYRYLHKALSAIEYLWRAGLKTGETQLEPLLKAQECLTEYADFGEGTIVGQMLTNQIITLSARTNTEVAE